MSVNTPPSFTEEMAVAGATALTERSPEVYSVRVTNHVTARRLTEQVLSAALAGRTVVHLPEPDGRDGGGPVWSMPGGASPVTLAVVDGEAFVSALGPGDPVDFAETYALAVLAAVREARRMVAESGEPR